MIASVLLAASSAGASSAASHTSRTLSYSEQIVKDVERSNATARDHAHAALHGGPRAEGSPAGEHAPALDADRRRDGPRGNQIHGAVVLNRRVHWLISTHR